VVIEVEKQSLICTSLHPKESPEESDWEDDENMDGGEGASISKCMKRNSMVIGFDFGNRRI